MNWLRRIRSVKLRWWHWALIGLALVYIVQLCIPSGTISVFSRIDGADKVKLRNIETVKSELGNKKLSVTLRYDTKTVVVPLADAGVQIDTVASTKDVSHVTMIGKLIPFGAIIQVVRPSHATVVRRVNTDQLSNYAQIAAKQQSYAATDATATVNEKGEMKISRQKDGKSYTTADIQKSIRSVTLTKGTVTPVRTKTLKPEITADMFTHVQKDFDAIKDQKLTVTYGDQTEVLVSKDFMPLLEVVTADKKTFKLQFKLSALEAYSVNWGKKYNIAPGVTQVTYYDSTETDRKTGSSGRAIDVDKVRDQLQTWVASPSSKPVTLATKTIAPKLVTSRYYSVSSAGLQAKLNDWIKQHGGGYQVAIQELNGQGRIASYNVAQQTTMASTYKLFVAFAAYTLAENGQLSLGATVYNGMSIEQCISKAIINSDNNCAIAIGKYIGWAKIDQMIAAAGFTNVHLNNYDANGNLSGDKLVNAGQLAKFLVQLSQGVLINSEHSSTLLSYMKQQVYRSGIPAGSHGSVVADKVGFLDGFTHDAGIVYSPKATYALVIMTNGTSNWSNIKDLASAVYDFMNQ